MRKFCFPVSVPNVSETGAVTPGLVGRRSRRPAAGARRAAPPARPAARPTTTPGSGAAAQRRHLDELLRPVRGAGLPVELRVEGEPRRLPPGVDLSAYRIVQEALTNALKHAGPAHAQRRGALPRARARARGARRRPRRAGGPRRRRPRPASGCASASALYGGELDAGARPGGGFACAPAAARAASADDPRPDRRRPGAGARRAAHDPRGAGRHRGRRRGRATAARRVELAARSCTRTSC